MEDKVWRRLLLALGASSLLATGAARTNGAQENTACTAQPGSTTFTCTDIQTSGISWNGVSGSGETVSYQATGITITNLSSNITGVAPLSGLTGAIVVS